MNKTITVYKNHIGDIHFIDNTLEPNDFEFNPDFLSCWEKSEVLFNILKKYQNDGYTIIFK